MPTDQQLTDLFTYILDVVATQQVILRRMAHGLSADEKLEIKREIQQETMRLYQIREVSDLRSGRNLDLLSSTVDAIKRDQWKP